MSKGAVDKIQFSFLLGVIASVANYEFWQKACCVARLLHWMWLYLWSKPFMHCMNRYQQFLQFHFIPLGFLTVLLQLFITPLLGHKVEYASWCSHHFIGSTVTLKLFISLWVNFAGNTCSPTVGCSSPAVCWHAHSLWLHHYITAGFCVW